MRVISETEKKIIESIKEPPVKTGFFQRSKNASALPDNIFRLSELGSLGCIKYVAIYLFHSNQKVREIASHKIHKLFLSVEDKDLNWLDVDLRRSYYYRPDLSSRRNWYELEVVTVDTLEFPKEELSSVLSILTCHSSGFVREAALKRLALVDAKSAIRMLFVRVNDWVKPIGLSATKTLIKLIEQQDENSVVDCLELLEQLRLRSRQDHQELISTIEKRLTSPEGVSALLRAVEGSRFCIARTAFSIAARVADKKEELLKLGLVNKDAVIRSMSLKAACEYLKGGELVVYLIEVSRDKLSLLQKKATYKLLDIDPKLARKPLIEFLKSENAQIRHFARFYLKREEDFDFASFYRDRLDETNTSKLTGIILGLSETGSENDWKSLEDFQTHSRPKVKAAVIRARGALVKDSHQWLIDILLNGCAAEVKAASEVLIVLNEYKSEELENLHEDFFDGVTGRAIRRLVVKRDYWRYIELLLKAIIKSGDHDFELYSSQVGSWLSKYGWKQWYVKPKGGVLLRVIELIEIIECSQGVDKNISALKALSTDLESRDL
ncbi:HEAT repeat domain-containing protein [Aliikangiella sp. IMCC44359]|uniref:HEAT repeat domain-containing protein n=1 Tax=Aliikangiella sp. IMCC44359 TaxID=3459125 RepID=UPI00403AA8B4